MSNGFDSLWRYDERISVQEMYEFAYGAQAMSFGREVSTPSLDGSGMPALPKFLRSHFDKLNVTVNQLSLSP